MRGRCLVIRLWAKIRESAGDFKRGLIDGWNMNARRDALIVRLKESVGRYESTNQAQALELNGQYKYQKRLLAKIADLETRLDIQRALIESATSDVPGLSPAEIERLAMLAEESAEVVQICAKILRHGWESCSPFDPKCRPNRVLLERELGDVRAVTDLICDAGEVRRIDIAGWRDLHKRSLREWTHHQGLEGK